MFRSSDDIRQSYVRGIENFKLKPVEFSVINGMAIFEGDIALGTEEDMETLRSAVEDRVTPESLRASGWPVEFDVVVEGVGITLASAGLQPELKEDLRQIGRA